MISNIEIHKYGSTRPCTLRFDPHLTVILGRNGTGRSELLVLFYYIWMRDHDGVTLETHKPVHVVSQQKTEIDSARAVDDWGDSMHYERGRSTIESVLRSGVQHVVTTQNPSLIDLIPVDDLEQLQQRFIFTFRDGDQFVWRNMTTEEALRVERSLKHNVMQLSEILRSEGLW